MSLEALALSDANLDAAVKAAIASKRIGTPVFVRLFLQSQDDGDESPWVKQVPENAHGFAFPYVFDIGSFERL